MRAKLAAEVFATFTLVLSGTGAIVFNQLGDGAITHVGISLVFGLVVFAMIHAVGEISGAHMNPAVTLGLCLARRFPAGDVVPYVLAQLIGAFLASGLLRFLFPEATTLGATHPWESLAPTSLQITQAFVLEVLLTGILMFTVLAVSYGPKEKGQTAGLVLGAIIGLEALFAGPISGASMNPTRSIAPAVCAGTVGDLWIYIAAPMLGAVLAIPLARIIHPQSLGTAADAAS